MDILKAIKKNRNLLDKIFSQDQELAAIREEFVRETGTGSLLGDTYTIATGHQPVPYYPGLLFKNYFTGSKAKEINGQALNFLVDSDQDEIEVPVPCMHEGNYCKDVIPLKRDKETVFSDFQPSDEDLKGFLDAIEDRLKTIDDDKFSRSFKKWKNDFNTLINENGCFIDALNQMRSRFEYDLGIQLWDRRISSVVNSRTYYRFLYYIIKNIETFREAFYGAVTKNSKDGYQSVKYIEKNDGWFELPFWLIKNKRRHSILLKKEEGVYIFSSDVLENTVRIEAKDHNDPVDELKERLLLYPKATTLTLLIRLFFCDLFIHGSGARDYEKVNNTFIMDFFNLDSKLIFYTVTGDIYLPLQYEMPDYKHVKKKYEDNRKWLKEAERNPEDLLDQAIAEKYKEKKKQVAMRMRDEADSTKRREYHQQLEKLDMEMRKILSKDIDRIKDQQEHLEYYLNNEKIFFERHYPYFIYPESALAPEKFEKNKIVEIFE